jgi:hypothetical protein
VVDYFEEPMVCYPEFNWQDNNTLGKGDYFFEDRSAIYQVFHEIAHALIHADTPLDYLAYRAALRAQFLDNPEPEIKERHRAHVFKDEEETDNTAFAILQQLQAKDLGVYTAEEMGIVRCFANQRLLTYL